MSEEAIVLVSARYHGVDIYLGCHGDGDEAVCPTWRENDSICWSMIGFQENSKCA